MIAQQGMLEQSYPDYRGGTVSWRARVENHSTVSWRTAPPTTAGPGVFAFTASTSDEEGDFALAIDGRPTLTFRSHRDREVHSWSGNGATLVYIPKGSAAGSTGFYLLSVPAEQITPGVPLELRVTGSGGDPLAWFMIKSYRDTLAVEHLTPAMAAEATRRPVAHAGPGVLAHAMSAPADAVAIGLALAIAAGAVLALGWLLRGERRRDAVGTRRADRGGPGAAAAHLDDFPRAQRGQAQGARRGPAAARRRPAGGEHHFRPVLMHALFQATLVPLFGIGFWTIRLYSLIGGVLCIRRRSRPAAPCACRSSPVSARRARRGPPVGVVLQPRHAGRRADLQQLLLLAALADA
jgi:hypothetical protein